jgi:hypothetical protein
MNRHMLLNLVLQVGGQFGPAVAIQMECICKEQSRMRSKSGDYIGRVVKLRGILLSEPAEFSDFSTDDGTWA